MKTLGFLATIAFCAIVIVAVIVGLQTANSEQTAVGLSVAVMAAIAIAIAAAKLGRQFDQWRVRHSRRTFTGYRPGSDVGVFLRQDRH